MTPLAFLHACAELEQSVGDLYRRFAQSLTAHPSTGRLFLELADQEDTHARAMQLMPRLMLGAMGSTTVGGDAEKVAGAMRADLARAKAMLDAGREVTAEGALRVAIRLESSMLEAHSPHFIETDSERLRRTAHMLATDTHQHKLKLESRLRSLRAGEKVREAAR